MYKYFILIFVLLTIALSSLAQIPSSCNSSTFFATTFDEDIQELAILDMLASNTPDSNVISPIFSYRQDILKALAAVANTANVLSEADSIFNIYCIHNEHQINRFVNSEILVELDPNIPWTANWINQSAPSGNAIIDSFLASHTYNPTHAFSFSTTWITLTFDSIINTKPIIEALAGLSGINYINGVPLTGDGDHISHTKVGNMSYLDFTLGWGDCSVGCTRERTWSFSVNLATCEVSYLGVTGDSPSSFISAPPDQSNCNITLSTPLVKDKTEMLPPVQIYPTPTSNLIHIVGDMEQIKIYNSIGVLVLDKQTNATTENIDLSHLANGIYYINIQQNQKTSTHKIIKQ